jgi:hypothetical protein
LNYRKEKSVRKLKARAFSRAVYFGLLIMGPKSTKSNTPDNQKHTRETEGIEIDEKRILFDEKSARATTKNPFQSFPLEILLAIVSPLSRLSKSYLKSTSVSSFTLFHKLSPPVDQGKSPLF